MYQDERPVSMKQKGREMDKQGWGRRGQTFAAGHCKPSSLLGFVLPGSRAAIDMCPADM